MRMHAALTRGLVLPLVLLGLLSTAPLVHAGDHSGTICKNQLASDVTFIQYRPNATYSLKSTATSVVCPLTRSTTNSSGGVINVDILNVGSQTTTCTGWSVNNNGALLGWNTQSWTGSGSHTLMLDLGGFGKSTPLSNYSVVCTIPGNSNGFVLGLYLGEAADPPAGF